MSVIAAALRELLALGVTGETLVSAIERIEAAANESAGRSNQAAKSSDELRRERNRRHYETRQQRLKASENRLNSDGDAKTSEPSESVLKRLNSDAGKTPLARVVDITPSTEITGSTTRKTREADFKTLSDEVSWPEFDPPSRADLDRLEAALHEAAGLAINAAAPAVLNLAPILKLGRQGEGPPCDLQADVLPAIRARSARAKPGSVRSWAFFTEAICDARDQRLAGAPKVVAFDASRPATASTGPPTYWQEQARLAQQSREVAERIKAEYAAK